MTDTSPIISGEDDEGVVEVAAPLQGVDHLANGLIHGGEHPQHEHPLLAHLEVFEPGHVLGGHLYTPAIREGFTLSPALGRVRLGTVGRGKRVFWFLLWPSALL